MPKFQTDWKQALLIIAYRRAIRHYQQAQGLYQAFADQEFNLSRRAILKSLAHQAAVQSRAHRHGLALLHAAVPAENETALDSLWRRLLLGAGLRAAIAWLDWDRLGYLLLLELLAEVRSRKTKG